MQALAHPRQSLVDPKTRKWNMVGVGAQGLGLHSLSHFVCVGYTTQTWFSVELDLRIDTGGLGVIRGTCM